jgi:hypothetical protein
MTIGIDYHKYVITTLKMDLVATIAVTALQSKNPFVSLLATSYAELIR